MPPSKSEFWVRLYLSKMIRSIYKAADSQGASNALGAQACVESALGMTQSSDSSIDQMMNSQQMTSNQALGGVQSSKSSLTISQESSSPLGGSSSRGSFATTSLTNQNMQNASEARGYNVYGAADGEAAGVTPGTGTFGWKKKTELGGP